MGPEPAATTASAATPAPARKRSGWVSGCVKVGMSPAEVFETAAGYAWCNARALDAGPDAAFQVSSSTLSEPLETHTFAGKAELGRMVEDRIRASGRAWSLSFGYITPVPRRQYFGVEFGPDARVRKVSDVWAGRLD